MLPPNDVHGDDAPLDSRVRARQWYVEFASVNWIVAVAPGETAALLAVGIPVKPESVGCTST